MSTESSVGDVNVPESPLDSPEIRRRVRELPPSATFVAILLAEHHPLTPQALADRSILPIRTVRYAIERLDDERLIETRQHGTDGRTRVYLLTDGTD